MERPYLLSISLISTPQKLSVRALVELSSIKELDIPLLDTHLDSTISPWENVRFFPKKSFCLQFECLDDEQNLIYSKEFTSHDFGVFQVELPSIIQSKKVHYLKIFEKSVVKGIDCFLGHYFPTFLNNDSKIIISDFDKTLVDTRYSTAKEMLESLRRPLSNFPTIPSSVQLLKSYMERGYLPFIVSASPHFYEIPFRDWLYQNEIHTSNIFLKDYRKIFSFFNEELTTKDIKHQGFYKLATIVDILLMCQLPQDIVLVGDGFESDMLIYIIIRLLIVEKADPYKLWKDLSKKKEFTLNAKQKSQFLLKVYELSNLSRIKWNCNVHIYIRCNEHIIENIKHRDLEDKKLNDQIKYVHFYNA